MPLLTPSKAIGLFQAFGIELEYMIVDRETLDVRPVCDKLLKIAAGNDTGEYQAHGSILTWSNELALHVVEFKNAEPVPSLDGLSDMFAKEIACANSLLEPMGAMLMPTAMHPWMNPYTETRLWPLENSTIYNTFDTIFSCKGHGWSNLQSMHVNLPFTGDDEFYALHTAIRTILPLLPGIAASSPVIDGVISGLDDNRLEVYRHNCARIPSITGRVVPEPVRSIDGYRRRILERMYIDIAPYDKFGVLQEEWLNARGAIARFDRGSIEIRVLDIQECPKADIAVAALVTEAVKQFCNGEPCPLDRQYALPTRILAENLMACIRHGHEAVIRNPQYLEAIGQTSPVTAGEFWLSFFERNRETLDKHADVLAMILRDGTLSRRILKRLNTTSRDTCAMRSIYRELSGCLAENRPFM